MFVDLLKPRQTNIRLTTENIQFLIHSLREAAVHNNLSNKFSSFENFDNDLCCKITGFIL
jgi:hypothetical protein